MILYRPPCPIILITADNYNICTGSTITFSSDVIYPGIWTTQYQWFYQPFLSIPQKLVGQTGSTLTYTNTSNNGQFWCYITGSTCNGSKSNIITIGVTQKRTPAITANYFSFQSYFCTDDDFYFYSTVYSGGTSPTFQWKHYEGAHWNAIIGEIGQTMIYNPYNGELIRVDMVSNDFCLTTTAAISNVLNMTGQTASGLPTVYITPTGSTCSGTTVTYTAIITSGGTSPSFIWFVNNAGIAGATLSAFTWTPLHNDKIEVELISNAPCVSTDPVYSVHNAVVNDLIPLQVYIETNPVSYWYNDFYGTGGTKSTSGSWTYHKYTSSGTFSNISGYTYAEVYVVGGGGGGGIGKCDITGNAAGGGGGAGEIRYVSSYLLSGSTPTLTVTIGPGGSGNGTGTSPGSNGSNSVFGTITALGGGGGGSAVEYVSLSLVGDGGSGGGGGFAIDMGAMPGGLGTGSGYVHNGGDGGGVIDYNSCGGGGGGGAGSVGKSGESGELGQGGAGISFTWDTTYNLGGGGCGNAAEHIGTHGGGNGGDWDMNGGNGTTNSGGGGGGTTCEVGGGNVGGSGGSGYVILRYRS